MTLKNQDILNAIRNENTQQYKDIIPMADGTNDLKIYERLEAYPTAKNEFINTLTNKVGKTLFFNKTYKNPLKVLHKGMLPFGKTIEQLFVEMAERRGWGEHFTGSTSDEKDLLGMLPPSVKVDYISQNYEYTFKTSISDDLLKGAFYNQHGLSNLLTSTMDSLITSGNNTEYKDMKKILTNATADSSNGSTIGQGIIQQMYANATTKANAIVPLGTNVDGKVIAKNVRKWASKLTFMSNKYNLAGVENHTPKNSLVFYTTPDHEADIDVDALAFAFNIDKANVQVRTLIVDDLGTVGTTKNNVIGILADKDLIQAYDTINKTTNFYNPHKLGTNYFAHKHGIMASCPYAQAIIFTDGDTIE